MPRTCLVSSTLFMSTGFSTPASGPSGFVLSSASTVTTLFLVFWLTSLVSPLNGTFLHRTSWNTIHACLTVNGTLPPPLNSDLICGLLCMIPACPATLSLHHGTQFKTQTNGDVIAPLQNQSAFVSVASRTHSAENRLVASVNFNNYYQLCPATNPVSLCLELTDPDLPTNQRNIQFVFNKWLNLSLWSGNLSELNLNSVTENLASNMSSEPAKTWQLGVETAINKLEQNVSDLCDAIKALSVESRTAAPPADYQGAPPSVYTSVAYEPRLCPPEPYKGDPDQCRPFLTQCEIHFQLQPSSFPNDRAKIAYIISL
ncbi:uncharacterized protein LOC106533466, partial [Austrofundulus limnaeus]|uniref:Uncharacterized protein LOC106533466 n=1 Tax=Austrofundulus limnaeus TaxID=52670 RepID=A0A2I4CYZ9_AUSLI